MKRIVNRITAILIIMMMAVPCTALSFADTAGTAGDEAVDTVTVEQDNTDMNKEADSQSDEDSQSMTVTYINPLYEDIITEADIPVPEETQTSEGGICLMSEDEDSQMMTCSSTSEAAKLLRNAMVKRTESIKFIRAFASKEERDNNWTSEFSNIMDAALQHTGNPEEGDYLKWQYKGWSSRGGTGSEEGVYFATYTYNISYFTTAQQEKQVGDKVNVILSGISSSASDYEVAKKIYDYICRNVKYDYAGASDSSNIICHSAYSAAVLKKSVCQGYSLLYYRAALKAGLDTRIIVGYNKYGGGHAWNIVKVNGKYYYLDSTWDAGLSSYKYFLKGKSTFTGHSSYSQVSTGSIYSINSSSYSYTPVKTYITSLKKGKKSFTVKWASKAKDVSGYQVRYSLKSSMKSSKTVTVSSPSATSKKISKLKKKKKYYVQVRTYKKIAGTAFYSSWSTKKSIKTK